MQLEALIGPNRTAADRMLDDLSHRGCAALGYRLSGGDRLEHLRVKHVRGQIRAVVAFETRTTAWVLLIGPHDDADPGRNVYSQLYELVGHDPLPDAGRRKPPCCDPDDQVPQLDEVVVIELVDRAHALAKNLSRRIGRRRR